MTELEHFKYNINYLFRQYEYNIEKFSKASGISKGLVSVYLKGNYMPSLKNIIKIADVFKCSVSYLLGRAYLPNYTPANQHLKFFIILSFVKDYKNVSFYEISKNANISMSYFSMWKKGVMPTVHKLIALSNYLDVDIDCLIGRNSFF